MFDKDAKTEILMISEVQQPLFIKHYDTPLERFHLLPPGIAQDRRAQRPGLMMAAIYRTVLAEVQADGYHVLTQRISLTPIRKLWLAWKTYVRG